MLQNYEDWKAETPAIILDIPGIQAKEHHTAEELRSLTLEALSVAYPSTTWARAYTDWSAEEAAKNGGGEVKSVATEQQSTNYRAEAFAFLAATQSLPTQSFWLTAGPFCSVFDHQERSRSSATSDRSCPYLRTKHLWPSSRSLLIVVLEAMRKQTGCQKWKASGSNMHTPCPTAKQRPSRGQHPPAGQSSSSHNL